MSVDQFGFLRSPVYNICLLSVQHIHILPIKRISFDEAIITVRVFSFRRRTYVLMAISKTAFLNILPHGSYSTFRGRTLLSLHSPHSVAASPRFRTTKPRSITPLMPRAQVVAPASPSIGLRLLTLSWAANASPGG